MKSRHGPKIKKNALLLLLWLVSSFSITALAGHEETWIDVISADRLKNLLDHGVKLSLVDLRPAQEFQVSSLPGARSVPSSEFGKRFNEIPRTGRVVLYCACQENELTDKVHFLKAQGYRNISVMLDRYPEWVKRGYPVDTRQ
jgi:rhodanese-related sulfurtransferase